MLDDSRFIDFNQSSELVNTYLGNAFKLKVRHEGHIYILKFGAPITAPRPSEMGSYENSPYSEYLGSHVFECLGIEAQRTYLGEYRGRLVVACQDFTDTRDVHSSLIEFKSLENSFVYGSSSTPGRTPILEDVERVLDTHPYLEPIRHDAQQRFWETLCVDSLIGNFDRHASNWGYLLNEETGSLYKCAPVYDCGSSLSQKLSEAAMADALEHPSHLKDIAVRPTMALIVGGAKPRYLDFFQSERSERARETLARVLDRVDIERLRSVIARMPAVSDVRREFYGAIIAERLDMFSGFITGDDASARENPSLDRSVTTPAPSWHMERCARNDERSL